MKWKISYTITSTAIKKYSNIKFSHIFLKSIYRSNCRQKHRSKLMKKESNKSKKQQKRRKSPSRMNSTRWSYASPSQKFNWRNYRIEKNVNDEYHISYGYYFFEYDLREFNLFKHLLIPIWLRFKFSPD